jgi:uridine kinase
MIVKNLQDKRVAVIAQDSFYKTLNITQQIFAAKSEYNFGSRTLF